MGMRDQDAGADRLSRREMITAVAGAATALAWAGPTSAARRLGPSDKVNLAVIGAGGKGADNMAKLTGQNIVAACDVDFEHVAAALTDKQGKIKPEREVLKAAYDKTQRYSDYRRMFDARKDIDAVI